MELLLSPSMEKVSLGFPSTSQTSNLVFLWFLRLKCLQVVVGNTFHRCHSLKACKSDSTQHSQRSSRTSNNSLKVSITSDHSKQTLVTCRTTWLGVVSLTILAKIHTVWSKETCLQQLLTPRCPITTSRVIIYLRQEAQGCSLTEVEMYSTTQWLLRCTCHSWTSLQDQKLEALATKIKTLETSV